MSKSKQYLILLFILSAFSIKDEQVTHWQFTLDASDNKGGQDAVLTFTATIEKGWYLYSSDFNLESGPNPTQFEYISNDTYQILEGVIAGKTEKKFESAFDGEVTYFRNKAVFRQKILLKSKYPVIQGQITGQVCNDKKGLCLPFTQPFSFKSKSE